MAAIFEPVRRQIKRTSVGGKVPTIPLTNDHTDNSWVDTDVYIGELYLNDKDKILYVRADDDSMLQFYASNPLPKIIQGNSYALTPEDHSLKLIFMNPSPITLEIPQGLQEWFDCKVISRGSGQIEFVSGGVIIHTQTITAPGEVSVSVVQTAIDEYGIYGDLI